TEQTGRDYLDVVQGGGERVLDTWLAAWEARGQDIPEGWDMVSKRIATACREAIHPNGISVHRGTVVIQANDVLRLLNMASPQPTTPAAQPSDAEWKDATIETYKELGFPESMQDVERFCRALLARLNQG